jgi:outer membrane protein insertion porin family
MKMLKKFKILYFLFLSFIYLNSATLANDNRIENINVIGTQRIDIETVVSYSNTNLGDVYSEELGNQILKDLFNTNLFSNLEISFENNSLLIEVKENPTINLVKFTGNSKIKDEDLLIEISLKERSVYSRNKVKKDIDRMLMLYQRSGRLSTEITPKVDLLENNRVNLTYEIEESDVAEVSKIIILGNSIYSSSKIKSIMKTKEKKLLRFLSSADRYDPDKLEYDKQLVTEFYNNNGYPEFKFTSSIAQLSLNKNDFEIILNVSEGDKYNFGKIQVTSELKKINAEMLSNRLPFKTGDLYNAGKIKQSVEQIKNTAELSGYTFIEINPQLNVDDENKEVSVNLEINEGPRVYVNEINITGNTRTVDKVIRREFSLTEGDAYNKFAINYSKDSIRALNFFSEVDIKEIRTEYPDKLNLEISVEEKNTGEASLGAGYSSATSTSLNIGLKETNFLGKGQKLNLTSSFASTRNTYDISYTEPYFNNKELALTGSIYSNFTDPTSVNYETEDLGLGVRAQFPIGPNTFLEGRYSLFTSKVKADSNATSYERLLAGTDTISTLGYKLKYDRRNSRYKPSSGFSFEIDQELAGIGGTSYYIKNRINYSTYKKLSDRFVGALKFQAGNLNGYNGKYAPLSSNYKLGGKKLRGFKSGKVGPRTGNSYTGGQYFYLTSLETNIDFNLDAFDITSTVFLDIGSVWGLENPAYSDIDGDHEMRSSLGVNFNWDSAIGPINIIYATVLESENTDTTDNLYFDIGYNF